MNQPGERHVNDGGAGYGRNPRYDPNSPGQPRPPAHKRSWAVPVLLIALVVVLIGSGGLVVAWMYATREQGVEAQQPAAPEVDPPPVPKTNTNICPGFEGSYESCAEWAPPEPRPFDEVAALDELPPAEQPPGTRWSPLYLCSYPPDELLHQHLGPNVGRAIINGFTCSYQSRNGAEGIMFDVYIGDNAGEGRFEDWNGVTGDTEIVDFNGRRVIVDRESDNEYVASRNWIMEIPGGGDKVIAMEYMAFLSSEPGAAVAGDRRAEETMRALAEVYRKRTEGGID